MKDWEIFEEDVAELLNGKRQAGSGNSCIAFKKGDIKCEDYLVECKYTEKDCYTLSSKTFEKIVYEAINCFKIPLFACRSKAGDFFIGYKLDFLDGECEYEDLGEVKSVKVTKPFQCKLKADNRVYDVVCWEVNLEDFD